MLMQEITHGPGGRQPLQARLAVHSRLRVMGKIERGEVDVGPLLGRGAFGRVYKGKTPMGPNALTFCLTKYKSGRPRAVAFPTQRSM